MAGSKQPSQLPLVGGEPALKPYKTFRIAVSGDVLLNRVEVDIIDTPEFQRLRRIRQLGTTAFVYPSAQHSRFEHSIGSVHMAERMMKLIEENHHSSEAEKQISSEQRQLTRLVALLHDIANIPFGHTLEDETCVIKSYQEDRNRYERFIGADTSIGKKIVAAIGKDRHERLLQILSTRKTQIDQLGNDAFIYDIVKNTVCSDLLDYLQRDAYFCALNLGFGDRFLRYMFLTEIRRESTNSRRLAIRLWRERDQRVRDDLLSELVQLLQARYHLGERVYFHHSKIITSAMLAKAVYYAMQDGKSRLTQDELYELGDDELLYKLREMKNSSASYYAVALAERRLWKPAYWLSRTEVEVEKTRNVLDDLTRDYHQNSYQRAETEGKLADLCGMDPDSVIIYCPDPTMNLKPAEMLVTWKSNVLPLRNIDEELIQDKIRTILNSHRQLWRLQVLIEPKYYDGDAHRLLERWCRYTFAGRLGRKPDMKSVVKETILDVAGQVGTAVKPDELKKAVEHFTANPGRHEELGLTREGIKGYIRKNFDDAKRLKAEEAQ